VRSNQPINGTPSAPSDLSAAEPWAGRRWLGVEFRHLGALAAVAREGSFRRAAERLGYVQSAISSQVAQLERAVGTQLVMRSTGAPSATLTQAGRVLLGHVDEILARFEAARIDLNTLAEGTSAVVRIGVLDGIGQRRLPRLLAAFHATVPDAQVIVDEARSDDRNLDRLAHGELDLAISQLPLPAGPFDHVVLEHDRYVLLVGRDSPLAQQPDPPEAQELARLPLILPVSRRSGDPLAVRLRESLIDQVPWLRPQSAAAAQALVGAGLGVAILPRLAVDPDEPATVMITAPALLPERHVVLVKHRERAYSAAVQLFVEILESGFASTSDRAL
jgi:DNA-binding transcriptional LysR family regulator